MNFSDLKFDSFNYFHVFDFSKMTNIVHAMKFKKILENTCFHK